MQAKRISIPTRYSLGSMILAVMLIIGCSTYARTSSVIVENREMPVEEFEADEFVGTPIVGDYDDNPDLDFMLEVMDGDRVFKINIHEDAGEGNRELIEKIREKINFMEDRQSLRVIGYYSPEFKSTNKEYGFLDLKCIVFYDEETGSEEAYFTDPNDSRFYTEGDVTIVYAPGHHYRKIYYPRYASPWWDSDWDGIPDRYDPWPFSYDIWYDYNLNFIPDWYDPYYVHYYPYWSHWNLSFWLGYNWYTPHYYRHYYPYGYTSVTYYNDYRTYTRLYDRRYVNDNSNARRRYARLDVKTEAHYRNRDRNTPRATSSAAGPRYSGYDAASRPDNRQLVTVNSRARGSASGAQNASIEGSDIETTRDFNRNRSADYTGPATTRDRTARVGILTAGKRKASSAATGSLRTSSRQRSTSVPRADRDLTRSRSRTTDSRAYKPATSSRSRYISAGSRSARPSSSRTYRGTSSRQRSYPSPSASSRVTSSRNRSTASSSRPSRSITRDRSSGSYPQASSASRPSSSSRSRPAPSARSAPSRSRSSSPAPSSARSSGGSSRSRSSSQGARRSSSGDRRRR
ncbi:MAG: hypothetical protein JRK26_06430 [Deltaproteobacteria bacterium]|nr:hypothetical protein [Deltaproteobacteria bacterium]